MNSLHLPTRTSTRLFLPAVLVALSFGLSSCPAKKKTATDLTGVRLTIQYTRTDLDQLRVYAAQGGTRLYGPRDVPGDPRALAPDQETVIILFDRNMGGELIQLIAHGLAGGNVQASGVIDVGSRLYPSRRIRSPKVPSSVLVGSAGRGTGW